YQDLRIEWCKSRARANRWQEEILLLQEEMKRVLRFFESQAQSWKLRAKFQPKNGGNDGRYAYACQQAALQEALKAHFQELWKDVDEMVQLKDKAVGKVRNPSPQLETIDEEEMMDCTED
ncbi:hypothetical protein BDN72DRAFT_779929, partial [Pluteus cervinus]